MMYEVWSGRRTKCDLKGRTIRQRQPRSEGKLGVEIVGIVNDPREVNEHYPCVDGC